MINTLSAWLQNARDCCATNFDVFAGWASIAGLFITLFTLWRVQSLRHALMVQALKLPQQNLFEHVKTTLVGKPRLTSSHERDIASLLRQVREGNCSRIPFRSLAVKRKIQHIKIDVQNKTKPDVIVTKLDELRILIGNG